jgi:2-polyprenyl-6-methoxyphenol hydroxylase-like FAD-dependent oxidoreductase
MSTNPRERAVVLGGSIAGLLAARVLADEYSAVTVVERDLLPTGPVVRRGVPQAGHTHAVLPSGRAVLEEMLPGLTGELMAAGALLGDVLGNVRWILGGRQLRLADTGLPMVSASRVLIESGVRARVRALPNVTLLDGYDIVGLGTSRDRERVISARVTSAYGDGSRVLPADLVVDATGRGSRTPRWLAEMGFPAPPVDRVRVDLSYTSRTFARPMGALADDIAVVTTRFPGQLRNGVMQRIEGDRVLVTLAGVLGERPPADLPGFLAYARTLATPDTYDVIRSARPIGDARTYRCPTYVRTRYERLESCPAGLLVTGDAACAFNPTFAVGMTAAAFGARALRDELRRGGPPDTARYFAALAGVLDSPWYQGVGADLAIPGVTGPALPPSPVTQAYLGRVREAATVDPAVSTALMRVTALVDPPSALLRREIADRVIRLGPAAAA